MKFKTWLKNVDDDVYKQIKLRLNDLPDEDFWIHWDNNVSSKEMAQIIIKDQHEFIDFMLINNA